MPDVSQIERGPGEMMGNAGPGMLAGLRVVAGLEPPVPPRVTRLAQGMLTPQGEIVDPLDADREDAPIGGR